MDLKPLISTFVLLFVSELGDKTQIAVILQAAKFQSPLLVLVGAALALTLVSAIGVGVGHACAAFLPRDLIRYIGGGLFIVMGSLMLLKVI